MKDLVNDMFETVMRSLTIETRYRLRKRAEAEKKTVQELVVFLLQEGANTAF